MNKSDQIIKEYLETLPENACLYSQKDKDNDELFVSLNLKNKQDFIESIKDFNRKLKIGGKLYIDNYEPVETHDQYIKDITSCGFVLESKKYITISNRNEDKLSTDFVFVKDRNIE